MAEGCEIIEQRNIRDAEPGTKIRRVEMPVTVGKSAGLRTDRACNRDGKGCGVTPGKITIGQRRKIGKVVIAVTSDALHEHTVASGKTDARVGAADICNKRLDHAAWPGCLPRMIIPRRSSSVTSFTSTVPTSLPFFMTLARSQSSITS